MKDDSHMRPVTVSVMEPEEVTRLARRAIAVLAAHGPGRSDGMARRLIQMSDAFISSDETQRHEVLLRLRQDGVSNEDLVDHLVPAVARLMGERWFADEISFAHVTIGAARLQETVRALGRRNEADAERAVLLVVPRAEHHTLGTFVLADQLRRRGVAVDIAVDRHPRQLAELMRKRRYHMVGITASGRRTLASVKELVDIIRSTVTRVTPVIIGGPVLDKDLDVLALTGADHIARDAASALMKCGLEQTGKRTLSMTNSNRTGNGVTGGEG
ncbi:cobalamin B12-binding domain-containing protein [Roseicyclus amphidinii]|uniref:cobalamin B12-binding domain-containing protein n=1 Tax=Roseicyclus amphidinii TaxID=3034232 RepID=UPI0024E04BEB|nr:cobalamin B12-binding domain-containing protein [Roseicyclus sp. Amp-Y-6]